MTTLRFIALAILLMSCSVSDKKRKVANTPPAVSKEEYFSNRGQTKPASFNFDGYKSQIYLFGKAFANKENRKFIKTASTLRQHLFENNLVSSGTDSAPEINCDEIMYMKRRTPDGSCYFHELVDKMSDRDKNLAYEVMMGAKGQRFGRNTPQEFANEASDLDIEDPNPFEISQRLFVRKEGKTREAAVINVLAAAWLQAMNHDWFTHGKNSKNRHHSIDGYSNHSHKNFHETVKVPMTRSEENEEKSVDDNGYDYTSRNQVTHWWDASQIYGSDMQTIKKVRTQYNSDGSSTGKLMPFGKIAVDEANKRLIYDPSTQLPITGFHDNWWLGLELIHTLFHLEHNRIVDRVLKPQIGSTICKNGRGASCDNEIFEKARLINSALIAKIHTVEWTPALLDHPMLHLGMRGNWYGQREVLGAESHFLRGLFPAEMKHFISGLVGPKTLDLYSVPFTLTEEFVAVYRMHPLIPETLQYRNPTEPYVVKKKVPVENVVFRKAVGQIKERGSKDQTALDWMYTFGTTHPGGLLLHNYPTFMQNFVAERNTGSAHSDSIRMDMGAIDIIRDRERGVPRYNNFRRALSLPPIEKFEDLTDDANDVAVLKDIYDNDVEKLDLLVGTLAEKDRYSGFAFGNTPFWIFAIMASRRLMADPFFSDYYTPEVYTKKGMKYVQKRNMVDVIVSHFPALTNKFYDVTKKKIGSGYNKKLVVKNAFRPWKPIYKKVYKQINPSK